MPTDVTGADINKATLKLFVSTVNRAGKLSIRRVSDEWKEASIPVDGIAPALDMLTPAQTFRIRKAYAGHWIELDITNLVKDWIALPATNKGLALTAENGSLLDALIDSKENTATGHQAVLDVVLNKTTGATGARGDTGATGATGAKGDTGATGATEQEVIAARQAQAEQEVIAARQAQAEQEVIPARQAQPEQEVIAARQAQPEQEVIAARQVQPEQEVIPVRQAQPEQEVIPARQVQPAQKVTPGQEARQALTLIYSPSARTATTVPAEP